MPLIVAIEPDARQAARLTDLVRNRVRADLVHAATTEQALVELAKIGDRVPDLVLVPSLLSPQEDAALAGALRIIATVANVRMLTIPVLADPEQAPAQRTVFARWRSRSVKRVPGACDPAIFADQISEYLREAAAERRARLADATPEISADETTPSFDEDQQLLEQALVAELQAVVEPEPPVDLTPPFELEPPPPRPTEPLPEFQLVALDKAQLEASLELELEFEEPTRVPQPTLELIAESEVEPEPLPVPVAETPSVAASAIEDASIDSVMVDELIAPLLRDLETARDRNAPMPQARREPEPDPLFFVEEIPVAPSRNEAAWMELIASLRQDIERLKQERAEGDTMAAAPKPRPTAAPRPARKQRPTQDQWGLFDPDQCGFGALLAKLDEINAREEVGV